MLHSWKTGKEPHPTSTHHLQPNVLKTTEQIICHNNSGSAQISLSAEAEDLVTSWKKPIPDGGKTNRRPRQGGKKRGIIPDTCSLKQERCFSAPRVVQLKSVLKCSAVRWVSSVGRAQIKLGSPLKPLENRAKWDEKKLKQKTKRRKKQTKSLYQSDERVTERRKRWQGGTETTLLFCN